MMSSADKQGFDDEALMRYLLGSLPPEEAERLEEATITGDEFAVRLDAAENDLVDAYVRGELAGEALQRFEKLYITSPHRRQKVKFARTLLSLEENAATAAAQATAAGIPAPQPQERTERGGSSRRWFTVPRLDLQWGFAAAALVMLLASGYLFVENERLRRQGTEAREQQAALENRAKEVERQLGDQRAANDEVLKELTRLRESLPGPGTLKTIAVLLLPPTRGIGQVTTVSVPRGTEQVTLRLQLESDDFPSYAVGLRDSVTSQTLWQSGGLKAEAAGPNKTVSLSIPAHLLQPQNYVLELSGVGPDGRAEFVSGYPIRVVLR
jgi:anti-sigma factor RsiW